MSLDLYVYTPDGGDPVFECNITHNLAPMARAAGLYDAMWGANGAFGENLVQELEAGLLALIADPRRFRELEPANRWGTYAVFVVDVIDFLDACRRHPDGHVRAYG